MNAINFIGPKTSENADMVMGGTAEGVEVMAQRFIMLFYHSQHELRKYYGEALTILSNMASSREAGALIQDTINLIVADVTEAVKAIENEWDLEDAEKLSSAVLQNASKEGDSIQATVLLKSVSGEGYPISINM